MQKYYSLEVDGTNIVSTDPLFHEGDELAKEKAENILKQLEGLKIITAHLILKKCQEALFQSDFKIGD